MQCYTKEQIQRLHLHFMHLAMENLYNLLKSATPEKLTPETSKILEDISKASEARQVYFTKPQNFQVQIPEGIIFNREVILDVMYIDSKPVIRIHETDTKFTAARFPAAVDTKTVWNNLLYG